MWLGMLLAGLIGSIAAGVTAANQAEQNQEYADWMQEQAEDEAEAEAEQAELEAEIARANAEKLREQAKSVMRQAGEITADIREKGEGVKGTQRAFIGKSGVEFSGSTEDVYEETERKISQDISRTLRNARERRDWLRDEADLVEKQAKQYEKQADYYNEAGQSASEYWGNYSQANDPALAGFTAGGLSFLGSATSFLSNFGNFGSGGNTNPAGQNPGNGYTWGDLN